MRRSFGSYAALSAMGALGVLVLSVIVFRVLASLAAAPAEAKRSEPVLRVEAIAVQPRDAQVVLTEFGVARSLDVVPVSPEVSGRIVAIHDRLYVGEVIPAGETLVQIDPRDYASRVAQAEGDVARLEASIQRLRTEWENDRARLTNLARSAELAMAEFTRLKQLFESEEVGTRSGVEAAERQYNAAKDAQDQMNRALSVFPIAIKEQEGQLAAAKAVLDTAKTNLERTAIRAPFDARIREESVELGQSVAPGAAIMTLADDSIIEISVALDSRDAQRWLPFKNGSAATEAAWFGEVEPVPCTIRWTENPEGQTWTGALYRVERFENDTRKVRVAVRIPGAEAQKAGGGLPLVDGMFCAVDIPGRTMTGVYAVPQWAVSYDGSVDEGRVYISKDNRLASAMVTVARRAKDTAYIDGGLEPGAVVITTRLVNPLENSLLEIASPAAQPDVVSESAQP